LEVSSAVRPIYGSLGVKRLRSVTESQGGEEYPTNNTKEGMLNGLVTSGVRTAF